MAATLGPVSAIREENYGAGTLYPYGIFCLEHVEPA